MQSNMFSKMSNVMFCLKAFRLDSKLSNNFFIVVLRIKVATVNHSSSNLSASAKAGISVGNIIRRLAGKRRDRRLSSARE